MLLMTQSVLSWGGPVFHVPLAVETWELAQETFSRLASDLAASHSVPKSKAAADIYGHLNLTLTRSVARAIPNVIRLCIYNSLDLSVHYPIYMYFCVRVR